MALSPLSTATMLLQQKILLGNILHPFIKAGITPTPRSFYFSTSRPISKASGALVSVLRALIKRAVPPSLRILLRRLVYAASPGLAWLGYKAWGLMGSRMEAHAD